MRVAVARFGSFIRRGANPRSDWAGHRHTLSATDVSGLEQKLRNFTAAKGSQIQILIIPTTAPEAIEQYSIRVAEKYKIGRQGVDDGIVLVVAKNDRKLRIEVGYGLEGAVPDVLASRIIDQVLKPHFKDQDFAGGLDAGVDRLIALIQTEKPPAPAATPTKDAHVKAVSALIVVVALFVVLAISFLIVFFDERRSKEREDKSVEAIRKYIKENNFADLRRTQASNQSRPRAPQTRTKARTRRSVDTPTPVWTSDTNSHRPDSSSRSSSDDSSGGGWSGGGGSLEEAAPQVVGKTSFSTPHPCGVLFE